MNYRKKSLSQIIILAVIMITIQLFAMTNAEARESSLESYEAADSIVQIYAIQSGTYYGSSPATQPQTRNIGSGIVLSNNRLLTNAHVISDNTGITVRKAFGSVWYKARVLYTAHKSDLALLTVDDKDFFSDLPHLEIGSLPSSNEKVLLYGFPESDTLIITDGIFSGVKHRKYVHSGHFLLAGEILSEVSSGSSGGPVIYNNKVAGLIMQANRSGTVAHMVPPSVIDHFLKDFEDGVYSGKHDKDLARIFYTKEHKFH